jgi:20S proteasome alpha/beta subunit
VTLIVGIKCSDGIVMGADGAATYAALQQQQLQPTIKQAVMKLQVLSDRVILGSSGPVGLAQLHHAEISHLWEHGALSGKKCHEARPILTKAILKNAEPALRVAAVAKDVLGPVALADAMCHTLIALPINKQPCLIQFSPQGASEEASDDLPFVSIGSGQTTADPFLAFLRKTFWPTKLPNLPEGTLAAVWTLRHAIDFAPGFIADPTRIAVLEKKTGDWKARMLSEQEKNDHEQMIVEMIKYIGKFPESMTAPTEPPPPPPPAAMGSAS